MIKTYHRHNRGKITVRSLSRMLFKNIIRRKILLVSLISLLIILPISYMVFKNKSNVEAAWYDTAWLYRRELVFNNSAQTSNLTNFPTLVVLSSSNFDFTQAQNAGQDIRFTDSDGSTLLSYEIETYDSVGKSARIWVNVPQINASSSTDFIYLYWGNSGASDAQSADNTWNSNYKGVYHLSDNVASANVTDSSGLGNTITASENTNNGFYQSSGKIGGSVLTAGNPTYITNQSGTPLSEVYADIVLDSNGYPVIAYTDLTNFDLVLVHCNDKECKGNDETVNIVDSTNSTGYYPSIQLDASGYPMIAYQYQTGLDLKYVHCNDANCAGGNETFSVIESTNNTGYYPRMVKDSSGYPVIAYYYGTGADLKIVHCGNADCSSGNTINTVDSAGTVGNGYLATDVVLDASGSPVISYYDTTNTELKVAHCNDVNCSGGDESLASPLSTLAKSLGSYTAIELDGSGLPMIAYANTTDTNLEFIHCDDSNCFGNESTSLKILDTTTISYPIMEKDSSGLPVVVAGSGNVYPRSYVCSDTNCTSSTVTYLALYNQYQGYTTGLKLDTNNNIYTTTYVRGKTNNYDVILYTTLPKLQRAYDSDFDFGTGSFSLSAWFKSSGMVQQNTLLSRYDVDQGFRLWFNYAGQPCFGIDDDATWGPDDSACSSSSQVSTNVDNGNATTTNWQSMVLDGNGYPVIAYYDATGLDLEIIHCNDANCSGNNENYANIDTTGNVGSTPSLVLDGSGYPIIAYYDTTNTSLKTVHCGNANCSSGNTINTLDGSGADDVGIFPTIKLDGSGFPVVSYYDTTNTAVKLIHCNDINCSGADESIVTLVNTEDDRLRHGSQSLELDGSGYPIVVYTDNTNNDLELIHCNDVNCDGVGETTTTIETAGNVGDFASMVKDSNGYPVIIHTDASNLDLRIVHCGNINCSSGNVSNTINAPNSGDFGYYELDIELNASGNPVILSTQLSSMSTYLTVCNDVNCSGGDETNSIIRDNVYNYLYHSLAIDSDSYPVISYSTNNDIRLVHMTNTTTYTESGNYDNNVWHHLVAVKNGASSISLYVDGVLVGTDATLAATGTLTSNSATFNLAEEITNSLSLNNWTGYLDEVQIDNTARSSDWVAAEYLSESNNFINVGITQNGPTANSLGNFTNNSGALKNNLVGYWKFDEGYGTTANNSGSGGTVDNGSITGATWSNSGKYGKAISLDGNDSITVSNLNNTNFPSNGTFTAWINVSSNLTIDGGSVLDSFSGSRNHVFVRFCSTGNGTCSGASSGTRQIQISFQNAAGYKYSRITTFPTDTWTHVVVIWDTTNDLGKVYFNGILDNSGTISDSTWVPDGETVSFGSGSIGLIDEVKIYNAALTPTEVQQDYNGGKSMSFGSLSDTSGLTGGSVASSSASATYCVPGDTTTCNPPKGEWNLEEGVGTNTYDASGNGNTGIITGTTWSSGRIGKGLTFNGSSDYVRVTAGAGAPLDIDSGAVTMEVWVKPHSVSANQMVIARGQYSGDGYAIRLNSNKFNLGSHGGSNFDGLTTIVADQWYHVVGVINGASSALYINGRLDQTGSVSIVTSDKDLYLGADWNGSTQAYFFNGTLDQARIFNYARTPAQIAWDYNQGKPIAHWKLDECSGINANNSSGNGNTGTITIGATGTNTSAGTCTGSAGEAWKDGAVGKYNSSLEFDGTDDRIGIPASTIFDVQNVTISAWVYSSNFTQNGFMFEKGAVNTQYSFFFAATGIVYFRTYNSVGAVNNLGPTLATLGINNSNWYHMVATYDGIKKRIYVNGTEKASVGYTETLKTGLGTAEGIGSFGTGNGYNFNGKIDDVRIYNYALTPVQIKQVYNNGAINFGPSTGSP